MKNLKHIIIYSIIALISLASVGNAATLVFPYQGGTGIGLYARGDIIIASTTNELYRVATGTEGQVLKITSGIPAWGADDSAPGGEPPWTITGKGILATGTANYIGVGTALQDIGTSTAYWGNAFITTLKLTNLLAEYHATSTINASSTAWTSDIYWTGTATNLVAATGRTSLGLGTMALANTTDYLATGTAATTYPTFTYVGINYVSTTTGATYLTSANAAINYLSTSSAVINYISTTTGATYLLGSASSSFAWRANNLSDLNSTATARINMGLVIGTDVQAYNANTATTGSSITGFAGIRTYTGGGTGTSTALALQNLWWGDGLGGLVQVSSSTLAAGGGVTSLNTLTGGLTLFDTSDITWTASGTVGLKGAIPNNATTGTSFVLSNMTGTLNIASTTLAAGRSLTLSGSTLDTDAELYTRTATFNFIAATTTEQYRRLSFRVPSAATITEIGCYTDTNTSALAFYEAAEITPNASSSSILNTITCDNNMQTTTTLVDSSIAARGIITAMVMSITNSTNTWAWISYTLDD